MQVGGEGLENRGGVNPLIVSGNPASLVEDSLAKQYLMSWSLRSGPVKASGTPRFLHQATAAQPGFEVGIQMQTPSLRGSEQTTSMGQITK